MNENNLKWLLEGPNWLKYAVEKQLLNKPSDAYPAVKDIQIEKLMTVLLGSKEGFDAILEGRASYKKEAFWYLYFLADIGFTAKDLSLVDEFKRIVTLEDEEHKFVLSKEMKPNHYCISSIFLYSLAKMSEDCKRKILPHVKSLIELQRLDGGWHCAKRRAVGEKLETSESCPMNNLNVLLLLSQYEEYRNDSRFNSAIDLLLSHWKNKEEHLRPYGFGVGTQFSKLRYPEPMYGILRVLDVLSMYPYAIKSNFFNSMLSDVREKSVDGRFSAESVVKLFSEFDFGQKIEQSRWITFVIERIEKRVKECR